MATLENWCLDGERDLIDQAKFYILYHLKGDPQNREWATDQAEKDMMSMLIKDVVKAAATELEEEGKL